MYTLSRDLKTLKVSPKDPSKPELVGELLDITDVFVGGADAWIPEHLRSSLRGDQQSRLVMLSFGSIPMVCILATDVRGVSVTIVQRILTSTAGVS